MTLAVPDEIADAAEEMAQQSGTAAAQLSPELQAEFDAWERASDEDEAYFERLQKLQAFTPAMSMKG